jgi:type 2A phosphatase activator TIP41
LYLFECDLEDSGYTMLQVRYRVMHDCFYMIIRYYLRVDGVRVRLMDTRVFHDFQTNYLLREFTHKEESFDNLRKLGFNPGSEWMLSATQGDEVGKFMPARTKVNDKVIF